MYNGREYDTRDVVIASGSLVTTSATMDLGREWGHIGLIAPTMTTGSIKFNVSADGTSYSRLKGSDATEVALAVGTGGAAFADVSFLAPFRFVQLVSATQAAARTVTFCLKS